MSHLVGLQYSLVTVIDLLVFSTPPGPGPGPGPGGGPDKRDLQCRPGVTAGLRADNKTEMLTLTRPGQAGPTPPTPPAVVAPLCQTVLSCTVVTVVHKLETSPQPQPEQNRYHTVELGIIIATYSRIQSSPQTKYLFLFGHLTVAELR